MIEGPQPHCDPNGWGLLINIDGVFIGMAVGVKLFSGFRETYGPPPSVAVLAERVNTCCGAGEAEQ